MRLYSRIDSLGRHILQVHLNQASRHNYGLRGLLQPLSDALSLTDWSPAQFPPVVGWLWRVQMHYMDQSSKVRKEPVWFVLVFLSVISAPRWDLNYRRFKKLESGTAFVPEPHPFLRAWCTRLLFYRNMLWRPVFYVVLCMISFSNSDGFATEILCAALCSGEFVVTRRTSARFNCALSCKPQVGL